MPSPRRFAFFALLLSAFLPLHAQNWGTPIWQDEFHQPAESAARSYEVEL